MDNEKERIKVGMKITTAIILIILWITVVMSLKCDVGGLINTKPSIFTIREFGFAITIFGFAEYGMYSIISVILDKLGKIIYGLFTGPTRVG